MEFDLMSIGILFLFAIVGGIIAKRFNQPAVLGLLFIGAIVGPNTLNIVSDEEMIETIIDVGAILLLFVVGLEFDLGKLMKMGFKAIMISILKVGIAFFIGFQAAIMLGYDATIGIFCGAILSFSSTVVIVKVLEQKSMYNRQETPLLLTVLILEDILAVIALIFFSGMQNNSGADLGEMAEHMIIGFTTLLVAYVIMLRLAQYIFKWIMKNSGDDITGFLALGFCTGFSTLAYILGFSSSAGAFLAGSIIASLPQAKSFEHAVSPYALMFGSLFFIAMGTMVNFDNIGPNINIIVVLLIAVLISRFIAVGLVSYVFAGFRGDQVFFSSIAMISVGEFALLIAKQSSGFNLGIDIVTITSVIIFITAVIMSISVAYSNKLNSTWSATKTPSYLNNSFSQLAWYVRNFFEQIDTENTETKRFKNSFFSTMISLIIFTYVFVGWDKAIALAQSLDAARYIIYMMHALFGIVILFGAYVIYKKARHTQETIIRVLTRIDRMMNQKKSQKILHNLFFVAVFFLSALFFPVAMYIFHLPIWTDVIAFILLALSFMYFNMTSKILSTYKSTGYTTGRLYNAVSLSKLYENEQKQGTQKKNAA